jgi:hypothetical protein
MRVARRTNWQDVEKGKINGFDAVCRFQPPCEKDGFFPLVLLPPGGGDYKGGQAVKTFSTTS